MNQNNFENNNGYPTNNQNNLGYQPTTPVPQPVDLMAPQQPNLMAAPQPDLLAPQANLNVAPQPDLLAPQAPVADANNQQGLMRPVYTNDVNVAIPPQMPSPDYNPNGVYDPNFNAGMSTYQPGMMNQPVIDRQMQTMAVPEMPKKPKDKKKILKIVGIIVILAALIAGVFFAIKLLFGNKGYTFETFTETDSFFIYNDGKYALFNEDGKQLSEFVFDDVGDFHGGVAVVRHTDGRDGVIKENGKYLIDLSEESIYDYYGLINVVNYDVENFGEKLLNYKGKAVVEAFEVDVDSFASGALFIVTSYDPKLNKTYHILNYAGKDMGTLADADEYSHYSYDGEYVTLISEDKTVLYNIEKAKKILETDGNYCVTDGTDKAVILNSCSISWSSSDTEETYKVVLNNKVAYTVDSSEYSLSLTEDGKVLRREQYGTYYTLLDDKGNVKQENIIGFLNGKNYIVEEDDRLMFYKNNERKNIVDCASYYQNADENTYIIKVDRYADGCKDDINNQYTYYNAAGENLSDPYYSATGFNKDGRAIVGTENLEKYLINDKYEIVSSKHYSIKSAGYLYIVWDEDYNQALMDRDGNLLEKVVLSYDTYGDPEKDDSFVAVSPKEDTYVIYNSKTGKKITTVEGEYLDLYKHYFVVDRDGKDYYYSYYTGKNFYSVEN